MPRPLYPLRLRPQTAIYKPSPRGGLVIPNRQAGGPPPPDVLTGLVTNADVNTNGRTDNVPWDWILGTAGTPFGTPTVSAGDGGFDGMDFNGVDQAMLMDASANGFLNGGDFTFGCRASGVGVVEMGVYAFSGGVGQASLHLPLNAGGVTLAFLRSDAGPNIQVQSTGTLVNDGVENTLVARFVDVGNVYEIWINGVLVNSGTGAVSPPITTTDHTWAAFIDPTPIIPFGGHMAWSAGWDRALTDEQMEYLPTVPNPFGRTP